MYAKGPLKMFSYRCSTVRMEGFLHGTTQVELINDQIVFMFWFWIYYTNQFVNIYFQKSISITYRSSILYKKYDCFRMKVTLGCSMHFQKFPFDGQICPLILESCKYKSNSFLLNLMGSDLFAFFLGQVKQLNLVFFFRNWLK